MSKFDSVGRGELAGLVDVAHPEEVPAQGTAVEAAVQEVSPAIAELLTHLEEEAAEIIQACTKLRRFGPVARDPRIHPSEAPTNRRALSMEFGQLACVVDCLMSLDAFYFVDDDIAQGWERKATRLVKYLKHSQLEIVEGEVRICPK